MTDRPADDPRLARPRDVEVTLRWDLTADGALDGVVEVLNVSGEPVRVGGQPGLAPLGVDGRRLPAHCIVPALLRRNAIVVLQPGHRARAHASWAGWNGQPASGRVVITVNGHEQTVTAVGPVQPHRVADGHATNLTSGWLELDDLDR